MEELKWKISGAKEVKKGNSVQRIPIKFAKTMFDSLNEITETFIRIGYDIVVNTGNPDVTDKRFFYCRASNKYIVDKRWREIHITATPVTIRIEI